MQEKKKSNMTTAVIIDDDFDTVEVFSEFLSLQNIDVLGKAYNGFDGIKLFEEKKPDIVFSDIWMPEYDGFYLLTNLRKKFKEAKIIMVTADLTQETDRKLKKCNVDAVIFKPFKISQIMEAVEKVSNKSKPVIST
jgi:DNA-binding NarL/FixJ family response regulator